MNLMMYHWLINKILQLLLDKEFGVAFLDCFILKYVSSDYNGNMTKPLSWLSQVLNTNLD